MQIVDELHPVFSKPLAVTIGFFDGVHRGHQQLLHSLKNYALSQGMLSGVVTFPTHPREVLQKDFVPQLLTDFPTRLSLLAQTGVEVCIVLNFTPKLSQLSSQAFVRLIHSSYRVNTLLMGYDHHFGSDKKQDFEHYVQIGREEGVEILQEQAFFPNGEHISSSLIRKKILSGEVKEAGQMLGRPYSIRGKVVHGYHVGSTELGFPTANIQVLFPSILPPCGAYAVRVKVENQLFGGMLNLGTRPTLYENGECTIEVHLFDFNGNLYGEEVQVEFLYFLRKEEKMDSKESLVQQLVVDKKHAIELLKSYLCK